MILQKSYQAFEGQYVCDVCRESVTNPLCPHCITEEILAWLTLYPNLKQELLPKLKKYLYKIEEKIEDSTRCIKCSNKRASICPYCFTEEVLNELKKIHANRIILKEFFQFFNFDFHHTGYHIEAEELGV